MRVVIVGAGEVGTLIARSLSDAHDVVIIDNDKARIEEIKYELDVLTLVGDGTSADILEEADIATADIMIASTGDDKTNLVACGAAKTLGDPFTIARVRRFEYKETWNRTKSAFGVDFLVCSDLQTAETIVNLIGLPAAIHVDPFAGGAVHLAEFIITEKSPIVGEQIVDVDYDDSLTFVALFRNGEIVLPRGETVIQNADRAVVIGSPESVHHFAQQMDPEATAGEVREVVVIGGSEIGFHVARILEQRKFKPRLIEADRNKARQLAEELPGTLVMQHDPTDTDFLRREHINEADIVVSALEADEMNMLVSLLAKRVGTDRVIAVVDEGNYVELFEEIGVDVAVNPRIVTAEEVTRFTHEEVALNVAVLENDQAEVLELEVSESSSLVGQSIQEIDESLPARVIFGAITREGELIVPRGDTILEPDDHIIVFLETPFVDEFMALT